MSPSTQVVPLSKPIIDNQDGNDVADVKKRIAEYKKRREKRQEEIEMRDAAQPSEMEEV